MEISSPNDSSSDSCSRSPTRDYGSQRRHYYDGSRSSSRDHPDVMIRIMHPDMITVVIGTIETSQMIGITTIEIGITALATMIGDIRTQIYI